MIDSRITADTPISQLSLEQCYEHVALLVDSLSNISPDWRHWYGGINTPTDDFVRFDSRDEFLARVREGVASEDAASFLVTSDSSLKGDTPSGAAQLWFNPSLGFVSFDVYQPDKAFGASRAAAAMLQALQSIAALEPVEFASTNVRSKIPGKKFPGSYNTSFAAFPHRKFIGWMGFVPRSVTSEQLPSAVELVPIAGKGTVILSLNEAFDLNNKAHIKQANIVEMELVDLDLLPVTDPSLM